MLIINYRLSLHMVVEGGRPKIVTAVIVVVVGVDHPDVLNIVVCLSAILRAFISLCYIYSSCLLIFLNGLLWCAVMVTGLPSSASWQDLKVKFYFGDYITPSKKQ